jgi:hypothetical protein
MVSQNKPFFLKHGLSQVFCDTNGKMIMYLITSKLGINLVNRYVPKYNMKMFIAVLFIIAPTSSNPNTLQ